MEQTAKKTKFDYFIGYYSSVGLGKEAKETVTGHVNMLKADKKLKAAYATHYAGYLNTLKFTACVKPSATETTSFTACECAKPYALKVPCFTAQLETLEKIKGDKKKTLAQRKAKLASQYKAKLSATLADKVCFHIGQLLTAFEKACNNLTFKPSRAFFDTLTDVRETLVSHEFNKRDLWQYFKMPDSQLMLSIQSTPVVDWILELDNSAELAFLALSKFEKSSQDDDKVRFSAIIGKLRTSLCERLYNDLNGTLVQDAKQEPAPNWLDAVSITDIIRGEYVSVPIGSESVPVAMLSAKEELARELAETDTRLAYALESESCRAGIFASIKAMTRDLEQGLSAAKDKTDFLISFFNANRGAYLQAYLDRAISRAVEGKGNSDKSHLSELNSLLTTYSVIAAPNNGEAKTVGVMGASELTHYIKFVCPWLSYKANDGGLYESAKWEGPVTVHKGDGFHVTAKDNVCLYPPITLMRYLTVKKTIQSQVRITNRARKRHNDGLKTTPPAK